MRKVTIEIKMITPYGQNDFVKSEKEAKESHDEHEKRCWKERAHVNKEGFIFVPPMAWKHAIAGAAKYLNLKKKGGGQATWTKHFKSGIVVAQEVSTNVKIDDVECHQQNVPSDGVAGGGKRVMKYFPMIPPGWTAILEVFVVDDEIQPTIFEKVFKAAGELIGVGWFRPERSGYWGRFEAKRYKWEEIS